MIQVDVSEKTYFRIEKPCSYEAVLHWQLPAQCLSEVEIITIQIQSLPPEPDDRGRPASIHLKHVHWMFNVESETSGKGTFKVPTRLPLGQKFNVTLCCNKSFCLDGGIIGNWCVFQMEDIFWTELTISELQQLYLRAIKFMENKGRQKESYCQFITRNKPKEYFDNVLRHQGGVMKVYMKDHNGDVASPINGRLKGLFFGTAVDKYTGLPPFWSHFGPKRLNLPAHLLLGGNINLYFTDFYCNNLAHYATLVVTHPGTKADDFCSRKLLKLDPRNNVFIKYNGDIVVVTQKIWVELLYTEDLDINYLLSLGAIMNDVPSTGTSRPEGIQKNSQCSICNL